jgi:exopolysaccharide production protein ExoZ
VESVLFIPYRGADGLYQPLIGQGWTLNYEMIFYALFAVALLLPRRTGLTAMLVALTVPAVIDTIYGDLGSFYITQKLLYFALGCAVAVIDPLVLKGRTFGPVACAGLMASHILIAFVPDLIGTGPDGWGWQAFHLLSGVFVPLTVWLFSRLAFERETMMARLAVQLGDASYSTYLFHGFSISWLVAAGALLAVQSYALATVLAVVGVIVGNVVGFAVFKGLETPLRRIDWSFGRKRRPGRA